MPKASFATPCLFTKHRQSIFCIVPIYSYGVPSRAGLRPQCKPMVNDRKNMIAEKIATMGRDELIRTLEGLHCHFEIDFTEEYLSSISLERLRHIVLAVSVHSDHAV